MPKVFYIAIISKDLSDSVCQRSAFTSSNRQTAIDTALRAREEWHHKGNGPYKIFVGELDTEIVVPIAINYTEVKIN